MRAYTALSWNYSPWIYNVVRDRWESHHHVFPSEEHRVTNTVVDHTNAQECATREDALFRKIELSEVPDPT